MIVIVIVSWNVCTLLRTCLQSVLAHPATSHTQRIIVVDNASSDGSVDMVRNDFPTVILVTNRTNGGFTGGNNDGIAVAETLFDSPLPDSSYVFLLNPDTVVKPGALDALLTYADANPTSGLLGPQLLFEDGSIQSSRRRFLQLHTALFESTWIQHLAPAGMLDAFYMKDKPEDRVCDVDWVYGAAMLVRRSTYHQCGVLDEKTFFMYSEEMDWCKRIKDTPINADDRKSTHWRVVYVPQSQIVHYEARSSTQVSAKRMVYFNTSKVRYIRKHHGVVQSTILRMALLSMFASQTVLECMKWLIGHKRNLRSQRIGAYIAVLRTGLV